MGALGSTCQAGADIAPISKLSKRNSQDDLRNRIQRKWSSPEGCCIVEWKFEPSDCPSRYFGEVERQAPTPSPYIHIRRIKLECKCLLSHGQPSKAIHKTAFRSHLQKYNQPRALVAN